MYSNPSDLKDIPLQYLANDENLAVYIASTGGDDVVPHEGNYVWHEVQIEDGRPRNDTFSLDHEGFKLVDHETAVSDFYNESEIENLYNEEIKSSVLKASGARRVEVFDHTRRAATDEVRKQHNIREPAAVIHNDYTAASGPRRLANYCQAREDRSCLLDQPFAIINVWRSINGPIQNYPLALCNATSTASEDLISVTRRSANRVGEIQMCLHNPLHRWFWFPAMQMNEALVFKTYDSRDDGRSRFVVHTSFDIPGCQVKRRESIETRCLVFF
jgi:hypothetical protein